MYGRKDELYPRNPHGVPADLTTPTPAYKRHAWLAFAGLLGFVALYMGLTGYLGWIIYRLFRDAVFGGNVMLGLFGSIPPVFFFVFLVRGFFVVKHYEDPSRVEVTPEDQPELFAFVHRIADEVGAPRPHKVFLSARVNAAVFYDLSFLSLVFPSKKNLELGLGLVNALTLDELKAVLAHEFGHFAQKTMAVGRWVYVAHQIAGHVIVARGWFDRMLHGLSYTDIRVAWIGWIARLFIWSIRAVLETAFRGIILLHRALMREQEFQADLVAVSLSGSDSLVHALHRLGPADDAWGRAARFADSEIAKKQPPKDLFSIQERILEHLRKILDDEQLGHVPERPRVARESHRVFEEELAMPPRMWSTHPPNREREDNAKQRYIPSFLEDRSGWALFQNVEQLREEVTRAFFDAGGPEPVEDPPVPLEETLARIDDDFGRPVHDRRYRGVYLGRSAVSCAAKVGDLYTDIGDPDEAALLEMLSALYPESLRAELERFFDLRGEKMLLTALQDGFLDAPGGVIRYRGDEIPKKKLPSVIENVERERAEQEEILLAHDRQARTVHRAAAHTMGGGWERYHTGLVRLLHYTDHVAANLRDAHGYTQHAVGIALADGHVSGRERRWLISAAADVHGAMEAIYHARGAMKLPEEIETEVGEMWGEFLEREWDFPVASELNLGDWLQAVDSWVFVTCGALEKVAGVTLEALLEVEDRIGACLREGEAPGEAPGTAETPPKYASFVESEGRERQKKLGWWDAFVTADGFVPGALRLVVASAVLLPALALGGLALGDATVHIYNGLGVPVEVEIDGQSFRVPARQAIEAEVAPTEDAEIVTTTEDGREVERFNADIDRGWSDYAYNVAGATPIVAWQAIYDSSGGSNSPERSMGTPRWTVTDADVVFRAPPTSVSTSGRSRRATRDVLTAVGDLPPAAQLRYVTDEASQRRMILAHARFDPTTDRHLGGWLTLLGTDPELAGIVRERIAAEPGDVFWLRAERDGAPDEGARHAVCERHRELAASSPDDSDMQYIRARCIEAPAARSRAYLDGHAAHPDNPWFAAAAGYEHARRGEWQDAMPLIGRGRSPRLAAIWSVMAVDLARVRRAATAGAVADVHLQDLRADSELLATFLAFEPGSEMPAPEVEQVVRPWWSLARGSLEAALSSPGLEGDVLDSLLRLVAASEGVDPTLASRAWSLGDEEGISGLTVWPTIALAMREGRDPTPFIEFARTIHQPEDMEAMMRVLDVSALQAEPRARMTEITNRLFPFLRGQALVMGIIFLGEEAPEAWRGAAQALLFTRERPFFRGPLGEAEPAAPEGALGQPPLGGLRGVFGNTL